MTSEFVEKLKEQKNSETVFLIGGGPSVLRYLPDPNILDGKDIIVGNNAYKLFPNAMLLHFMDWKWLTWHMEPEHDVFNTYKGKFITSCADITRERIEAKGVHVFYKGSPNGTKGLDSDPKKLEGHNTGHQMINIATHMEYKNIILFGYDQLPEDHCNWHQDHKQPTNSAHYKASMTPGFEKLAKDLENYNSTVYNINPKSALTCFPTTTLDKWL